MKPESRLQMAHFNLTRISLAKRAVFAAMLWLSLSDISVAQQYFNFDIHSNSGTIDHLSGSLTVGTGSNFSGLLLSSALSYMTPTGATTTPIGVTNIQFNSGTFGGTAGAYYVASVDFYYLDANSNAYHVTGSGANGTNAPFDIWAATYSNGVYAQAGSKPIYNNEKIVEAGTGSATGAFSATPLNLNTVPEINAGSLPKGVLLLFSLYLLFRKQHTANE